MRARAFVAVLIAGASMGPPAALAHEAYRVREVAFTTYGSIEIAWHGDPARGCAQAGLCGYSGTVSYPRPRASIEWAGTSSHLDDGTGLLDVRGPTRIRVRREVPGGPPALCRATKRFVAFTLELSRAYGGRVWLGLGTEIFPTPTVADQCAGPLLRDVTPSLPSAAIRLRHVAHRGARVSLAGRFPFHRGSLSGEVVSTLRMTSRGARTPHDDTTFEPRHVDRHRRLIVEVGYRVERLQGEVRRDFRAVDAPICELRDACGTHGSEVYSVAQEGGTVDLFGSAKTNSGHAPSLRRAIRRVARHSGVEGFGEGGRAAGLTTDVLIRPGAPRCTDRLRPAVGYLLLGARRRVTAQLYADGPVLDGRCPGPAELSHSSLARGRFDVGMLAQRSLELVLRRGRRFEAGAYRGRESAHVEVRLRRVHALVRVVTPNRDGSISY